MKGLEYIESLVKKYNLKNKSKERKYSYNRFALFNFCRKNGMTYSSISRLVNVDHTSVMHGISRHRDFMRMNDSIYSSETLSIELDLISCPTIEVKKRKTKIIEVKENPIITLINRIFEARDMKDIEAIKAYVNENINPNKL